MANEEQDVGLHARVVDGVTSAFRGAVGEARETRGAIIEAGQEFGGGSERDVAAYWVRQIKESIIHALRGVLGTEGARERSQPELSAVVIASSLGYAAAMKRGVTSSEGGVMRIWGTPAVVDDTLAKVGADDEFWLAAKHSILLLLDSVTLSVDEGGVARTRTRYAVEPTGAVWLGPAAASRGELAEPENWSVPDPTRFPFGRLRATDNPDEPIVVVR